MASMHGKVNVDGLKKFKQSMSKMNESQRSEWTEAALRELAARLLARVIKRTPVGKYRIAYAHTLKSGKNKGQTVTRYKNPSGKKGGTLKRGWTGGEKVNPEEFAKLLRVTKAGDQYSIEITNPLEYAEYVEFGHRKANRKGWVEGKFMLTISEQELQRDAPKILMNKLKRFIGGVFS